MIYTGYYAKTQDYIEEGLTPIAISGKAPIWFEGLHWKFLAPSWGIFSKWKDGVINDFGYLERFNNEILSKINKEDLKQTLLQIKDPILLCYEKEGFCHRHIVADWIENNLGMRVDEYVF